MDYKFLLRDLEPGARTFSGFDPEVLVNKSTNLDTILLYSIALSLRRISEKLDY